MRLRRMDYETTMHFINWLFVRCEMDRGRTLRVISRTERYPAVGDRLVALMRREQGAAAPQPGRKA